MIVNGAGTPSPRLDALLPAAAPFGAFGSTIQIYMDRRILLLALALVPPFTHAAGDAPIDRTTLKGLKAVGVVIDVIDPEVEKAGVTRDLMLTRLLSRLSSDRIKVDPGAMEFLGLRITAVRSGRGPFALSMTVGLYQPVLLSRNHDLRTSTQTWEVESVLLADSKILITACSESADDLIDRFARAFHATNPE
jgi:hypothetical protein